MCIQENKEEERLWEYRRERVLLLTRTKSIWYRQSRKCGVMDGTSEGLGIHKFSTSDVGQKQLRTECVI
jgi:hypothetical protein